MSCDWVRPRIKKHLYEEHFFFKAIPLLTQQSRLIVSTLVHAFLSKSNLYISVESSALGSLAQSNLPSWLGLLSFYFINFYKIYAKA